ncbi:MAG: HPr family phosphocarrier protein [Spirochaetaceae bacterium]|jgi:phosphocarrier protein|nr:HPr family phosphocarrier protein [Spirochaetaceae bacterium]
MAERIITVSNRAGVHARPAAMIVQAAKDFQGNIYLEKDTERINGKSIMGLLTLGAVYGTELKIVTDGADAEQALEVIIKLFESNFEE